MTISIMDLKPEARRIINEIIANALLRELRKKQVEDEGESSSNQTEIYEGGTAEA